MQLSFGRHIIGRIDIDFSEAVQTRMTKMIPGKRNLSYKDRLKLLYLHSQERRRTRGDMIEVFKWVKGINKGSIDQVLDVSNQDTRTRGNGYKFEKLRFKTDVGQILIF